MNKRICLMRLIYYLIYLKIKKFMIIIIEDYLLYKKVKKKSNIALSIAQRP
jgi:hypothetical protein